MTAPLLAIEGLSKSYGTFQAVKRPATFLFYSAPVGPTNPNWTALGYAPTSPPPTRHGPDGAEA